MTRDDGGPAFATPSVFDKDGLQLERGDCGMSLRDYFAGQALAGIQANPVNADVSDEIAAGMAYDLADAMIAVREGK